MKSFNEVTNLLFLTNSKENSCWFDHCGCDNDCGCDDCGCDDHRGCHREDPCPSEW